MQFFKLQKYKKIKKNSKQKDKEMKKNSYHKKYNIIGIKRLIKNKKKSNWSNFLIITVLPTFWEKKKELGEIKRILKSENNIF